MLAERLSSGHTLAFIEVLRCGCFLIEPRTRSAMLVSGILEAILRKLAEAEVHGVRSFVLKRSLNFWLMLDRDLRA